MISEIFTNISAAVLYDVFKEGIRLLKARSLLKQLFRGGDITLLVPSIQQGDFFIPIVQRKSSIPENVPLLPFPETIGISFLFDTLKKLFPQKKIRLEPANMAVNVQAHLISVGGPSVNPITHELLNKQKISHSISIVYPDHYVVDAMKKAEYRSTQKNGKIIDDYGFIIVARNPYASNYIAVILMGVWAHGTNSAVQTLLTIGNLKLKMQNGRKLTKKNIKNLIRAVREGRASCLSIISYSRVLGLLTGEPSILDIRVE